MQISYRSLDNITKNPFAYEHWGSTTIGFWVPYLAEPLWWTGSGFKNLAIVNAQPEEFSSISLAESKIRDQLIDHINQYRSDQINLIKGW